MRKAARQCTVLHWTATLDQHVCRRLLIQGAQGARHGSNIQSRCKQPGVDATVDDVGQGMMLLVEANGNTGGSSEASSALVHQGRCLCSTAEVFAPGKLGISTNALRAAASSHT
jgi:hypothetical protein